MTTLQEDFISKENRKFKWKIGNLIASSLSGFIVGIIITVIIFFTLFDITWKVSEIAMP